MSSQLPAGYSPPGGVRVAQPQRPAWLLPVAIGGGLALVVIISRRGQSAPTAVSMQPDNAAGSIADGADATVNKALESFSATLSAQQQSESDMISGLGKSFGDMLTSDAATRQAQYAAQTNAFTQMVAALQKMFGVQGGTQQTGGGSPLSTPSPAQAPGVPMTPGNIPVTWNILAGYNAAMASWRDSSGRNPYDHLLSWLGDLQNIAKSRGLLLTQEQVNEAARFGVGDMTIIPGSGFSAAAYGGQVAAHNWNPGQVLDAVLAGMKAGSGASTPAPSSVAPAPAPSTWSGQLFTAPMPVLPTVEASYTGGSILGRYYKAGYPITSRENNYGAGFSTPQ